MDDDMYIVNVDQCIADRSQPAVVRQLFMDIRDKGYVMAGDFYREMPQPDLDTLRQFVEMSENEGYTQQQQEAAAGVVTLVALGLTVGEGMSVTEKTVIEAARTVVLYTSLEQLARAGLCKVYRENWTMDLHSDAIVAGPLE